MASEYVGEEKDADIPPSIANTDSGYHFVKGLEKGKITKPKRWDFTWGNLLTMLLN